MHKALEERLAELFVFALYSFSHSGFLLSLVTLGRLQADVHFGVELAGHATFFVQILDFGHVLVEALTVVAGVRFRPSASSSSWNGRFWRKLWQSILRIRIF